MHRGGRVGRCGFFTPVVILVIAGSAAVMVGGCGSDTSEETGSATTATSSSASGGAQGPAEGEGVALAQEILAAFDEMAAAVSALAEDEPEPATLKPQLEELYDSYLPRMTELNGRYLALRDADVRAFAECNGHLSDNRPQHITAMQDGLADAIKYYNFELGDREIVDLLTSRAVELLDVAVERD